MTGACRARCPGVVSAEEEAPYEVVVIGAGPAGASSAYAAARRGFRTLLVEKRGPPRDKVCGGLLTNLCVDAVRGATGSAVPKEVQIPPSPMPVFVVPPSGVAHGFLVPGEYVLNVTRRAFDGWLASRAEDAGAEVRRDTEILGFESREDRVDVLLRTPGGLRTVQTACLIGADGVYSKVREQMRPRPLANRAYYIQEYYPRTGDFEDLFYLLYRGDTSPIYAYVIPKFEELCVGIGVHKSVPPRFDAGISRFKEWLQEQFGFRDTGVRRREGFAVPFGNVFLGAGRVLLAGDAAGLCYPPTGEGITFAVQSGVAAVEALALRQDDAVPAYRERMEKAVSQIEAAAARTLALTDPERETRIQGKAGL